MAGPGEAPCFGDATLASDRWCSVHDSGIDDKVMDPVRATGLIGSVRGRKEGWLNGSEKGRSFSGHRWRGGIVEAYVAGEMGEARRSMVMGSDSLISTP